MSLPKNEDELMEVARVADVNLKAGDWVETVYSDESFFVDNLTGVHKLGNDPKPTGS